MFDGELLFKWGIWNIGKGSKSLLSNSLVLIFLLSIITDRSKNEAWEVIILSLLNFSSGGYISSYFFSTPDDSL